MNHADGHISSCIEEAHGYVQTSPILCERAWSVFERLIAFSRQQRSREKFARFRETGLAVQDQGGLRIFVRIERHQLIVYFHNQGWRVRARVVRSCKERLKNGLDDDTRSRYRNEQLQGMWL